MDNNKFNFLVGAIFLSIAFIVSSIIVANGFSNIQNSSNTITVKGYAEKLLRSDYAVWSISINSRANSLAEAYAKINESKRIIIDYLNNKGFATKDISESSLNNFTIYNYSSSGVEIGVKGYQMSQTLTVSSKDLDKIKNLSLEINSLLSQGIEFISNPPEYYIEDIAKYKISMLSEAILDAQARASAIAASSGNKIGNIKAAKQGIFQITAPNSTEISDWGINDVSSIDKAIKAVVDVTFYIK